MHFLGKRTAIAASAIALGALASVAMRGPKPLVRADEVSRIVIKGEKVELSADKFPDEKFRQELEKYDLNTDGILQEEEVSAITTLDLKDSGIKDLTGIGLLSSLETLDCSGCEITKIDLEGCYGLKELNCSGTNLTEIDVTLLADLVNLNVSGTKITDLHLCQNKKLVTLDCSNTDLESLEIRWIQTITNLDIADTKIKYLNVMSCSALVDLVENITPVESEGKYYIYEKSEESDLFYIRCNKETNLAVDRIPTPTPYPPYTVPDVTSMKLEDAYDKVRKSFGRPAFCGTYISVELEEGADPSKDLYVKEQSPEAGSIYYGNHSSFGISFTVTDKVPPTPTPTFTPTPTHTPTPTPTPTLKAVQMPDVVGWDYVEAERTIETVLTLTQRAFQSVTFEIEWVENTYPEQDLTVLEQDPVAGEILYGDGKSSQHVTLKVAKEASPTTMPDVTGTNYEEAQEAIVNELTQYGFKVVNFEIVWVDNKDPQKDLTVLEQDPVAGAAIYADPPELDVTLKVAKKAKDPTFEDFVERLYTVALNRESDQEGKAFWVYKVENGEYNGADCARFFLLEADEFMKRKLSVEDFVETLYATFFDRESDPAGKQGWVEAIKSGKKTKTEVVNDFIESTEWCDVCATYGVKSGAQWHKATKASKNATNFATRLYTCCLKRDPEEGGIKYWSLALTNLEKTGAQAAQFFFESEEFIGFNTTDKDYILRLYTTFMDREPEDSEINYWLGELEAGKQSRKSIISFFAQSPEFTEICKKYGIDRGEIA